MNNNYNNNTTNQEMLRVLLDINRGLNTIERTTVNTDKNVSQVHTILMSKVAQNTPNINHVIVPDVRRSERLKAKKNAKKSPSAKKNNNTKKSGFSFF